LKLRGFKEMFHIQTVSDETETVKDLKNLGYDHNLKEIKGRPIREKPGQPSGGFAKLCPHASDGQTGRGGTHSWKLFPVMSQCTDCGYMSRWWCINCEKKRAKKCCGVCCGVVEAREEIPSRVYFAEEFPSAKDHPLASEVIGTWEGGLEVTKGASTITDLQLTIRRNEVGELVRLYLAFAGQKKAKAPTPRTPPEGEPKTGAFIRDFVSTLAQRDQKARRRNNTWHQCPAERDDLTMLRSVGVFDCHDLNSEVEIEDGKVKFGGRVYVVQWVTKLLPEYPSEWTKFVYHEARAAPEDGCGKISRSSHFPGDRLEITLDDGATKLHFLNPTSDVAFYCPGVHWTIHDPRYGVWITAMSLSKETRPTRLVIAKGGGTIQWMSEPTEIIRARPRGTNSKVPTQPWKWSAELGQGDLTDIQTQQVYECPFQRGVASPKLNGLPFVTALLQGRPRTRARQGPALLRSVLGPIGFPSKKFCLQDQRTRIFVQARAFSACVIYFEVNV
jgi:hypothetical protein